MTKKTFIIVYEMTEEDGVMDEKPIFNCDTINEALIIFAKKWNIKTSKQNISNCIIKNGILKDKYKIFRIND